MGTSRPQLYCGPASRLGHFLALLTRCQACKFFCMLHPTLQFFQLHQFPFSTTSISIAITSISKHNYINFHCQLHLFPLPLHQCPISTTSISIAHINSMPASIFFTTKSMAQCHEQFARRLSRVHSINISTALCGQVQSFSRPLCPLHAPSACHTTGAVNYLASLRNAPT